MRLFLFSDLHRDTGVDADLVVRARTADVVVAGAGDCSTAHRGLDEILSIGTLPRCLVVVCVNTDRYLVDETMTVERVRTAYLILALCFVHNSVQYQDLVWCPGPSQWQPKLDLPGTSVPAVA